MRRVTISLCFVVLIVILGTGSGSPILDFLDPFLNLGKEKEINEDDDKGGERGDERLGGERLGAGLGGERLGASLGGERLGASLGGERLGASLGGERLGSLGGSIAGSGRVDAELENSIGFNGDRAEFQERPSLLPIPNNMRPPPPRPQQMRYPQPYPMKQQQQPCDHQLPQRPIMPHPQQHPLPPPPNQRDGPFFKKNFRNTNANINDSATPIVKDPYGVGDIHKDDDAHRQERSPLDKDLLHKNATVAANATLVTNTTTTNTTNDSRTNLTNDGRIVSPKMAGVAHMLHNMVAG